MELDALKSYLIPKILQWVNEQRELHLSRSRVLSNEEKLVSEKYFEKRIINYSIKVAVVESISNPKFYPELIKQGITIPLDFSKKSVLIKSDPPLLTKSDPFC